MKFSLLPPHTSARSSLFSPSHPHLLYHNGILSMNFTVLPPLVIIGGGGKIADFSSKTPTMTSIFALLFTGPWNMLDGAWVSVLGYHADDFQFTPGQTPLSIFKETAAMLVIYYSVILGGRNWMRNRPAFKLNTLFLIHNFYLTAISGILLVLFLEQLIPRLWSHGLYDGICGAGGWTDKLVVLYYLNYLTKYLEFVDTCFLFLKKKPLREF
jgi:fatty acid elongase 3